MYIKLGNVNSYYEQSGSGRPLILLHGNGENHHIFDELSRSLSEVYSVYLLDSRGHGKSSKAPVGYGLMTEDVARFIQEMGLEKPALLGFSDGGIIGLKLASQYPDLLSALIAAGPNCNPQGLKKGWLNWFRFCWFFNRSPLLRMILDEPDIKPEELKRISIPVLITGGERDMIRREHLEEIAANIPSAQLKILPDETHASYIVHQKKFGPVVTNFLDGEQPEVSESESSLS